MAGNQYQTDPRQSLFLQYYLDRDSETFSNGLQSALKAGYELEYAKVIIANMPDWLSEKLNDEETAQQAERNLKKFLNDDGNPSIQADMTKFTLKGLRKEKFSERQELTGKDGKDLAQGYVYVGDLKRDKENTNAT